MAFEEKFFKYELSYDTRVAYQVMIPMSGSEYFSKILEDHVSKLKK